MTDRELLGKILEIVSNTSAYAYAYKLKDPIANMIGKHLAECPGVESRVQVLEKIVTSSGYDVAQKIDALSVAPDHDGHGQ